MDTEPHSYPITIVRLVYLSHYDGLKPSVSRLPSYGHLSLQAASKNINQFEFGGGWGGGGGGGGEGGQYSSLIFLRSCIYPQHKYNLIFVNLFLVANYNVHTEKLNKLAHNCGLPPHCLLDPPSVGCGHKIDLRKNMSYWRTCFSRVDVFQDDSICLKGGHAL